MAALLGPGYYNELPPGYYAVGSRDVRYSTGFLGAGEDAIDVAIPGAIFTGELTGPNDSDSFFDKIAQVAPFVFAALPFAAAAGVLGATAETGAAVLSAEAAAPAAALMPAAVPAGAGELASWGLTQSAPGLWTVAEAAALPFGVSEALSLAKLIGTTKAIGANRGKGTADVAGLNFNGTTTVQPARLTSSAPSSGSAPTPAGAVAAAATSGPWPLIGALLLILWLSHGH